MRRTWRSWGPAARSLEFSRIDVYLEGNIQAGTAYILGTFWKEHPDAEGPLRAWSKEVERADWTTPAQVRDRFPRASIVRDNRVVFDIGGNRFRLVA